MVKGIGLYGLVAGVALSTFLLTSFRCRSQHEQSSTVVSALDSVHKANSDRQLARLAVVTSSLQSTEAELTESRAATRRAQDLAQNLRQQIKDLELEVELLHAKLLERSQTVGATAGREEQLSAEVRRLQGMVDRKDAELQAALEDPPAAPVAAAPSVEQRGGSLRASNAFSSTSCSQQFVWGTIPGMPACTGPPSTAGPNPTKTSVQHFVSSDFAEISVYNLLCTDGDKPVFIDDSMKEGKPAWGHWGIGDVAEGYHTFDVYPRPPPKSRMLPVNSRARPYYMPSSALENAVWSDKAFWLIEPEYRTWEMQHLFFFSHGVFPMWEAQMSNDTWGGSIPPIEDVFYMVQEKYHFNDWNTNILDLIVPPSGTVHYRDVLSEYSKDRLLCTRRGVLASNKPNLFSGMRPATLFRDQAYARYGLKMPRQPPKKLIIFNRANAGRRFQNMEEMEDLFKRYDIPYEVVSKHGSFEKQVRTMASAGVLILAHGAAATNTMFQPHRSVIIEVFPYLRKRFGFKTVADTIGNFYYPIFAWDKPRSGKDIMNQTQFIESCEHLSSIKTNAVGFCDQAQKVVTITVNLEVLEQTLIDSFDTIGYRIYDKTKVSKIPGKSVANELDDTTGFNEW